MNVEVGTHTIVIDRSVDINAGEYGATKCHFTFSEEYTGLTKVAIFTTCSNESVRVVIGDNQCTIPEEVLEQEGNIKLGVYGYENQNGNLVLRYSPKAQYFNVLGGSYRNPGTPVPDEWEELAEQVAQNTDDIGDLQRDKADKSELADVAFSGSYNDLSNTPDLSHFITKDVDNLTNYTKTSDLAQVALSGSYNDLSNKPNLNVYSLITETGSKIDLEIDSTEYILVAKLYDKNNNLISTSTGIDLPLESVVVSGRYDSTTKTIILTLQNGTTIDVPVGDLVAGLQTEITSNNMLSSDLVDDTGHAHKFVTEQDKTNWNNKSDFSGNYADLSGKPDLSVYELSSNKVTTLSSSSTDTQYPSAKCVYDLVGDIENILTTLDVGSGV